MSVLPLVWTPVPLHGAQRRDLPKLEPLHFSQRLILR